MMELSLTVNGRRCTVHVDPATTLVEVLRDELGLTGTKIGCDRGACSACTVWIDGEVAASCMTFALDARDKQVTTIEGLAQGEQLHPVQQAFVEHDALQCGYCTPGQIVSAVAMLEEAKAGWPSVVSKDLNATEVVLQEDEIRERMSGNLCRCAAYANIVSAIAQVAR